MNITPLDFELVEAHINYGVRSPGVHLSEVTRDIAVRTGILKDDGGPLNVTKMAAGMGWEEWVVPRVHSAHGVCYHPGEFIVDGVAMTPDGVSYVGDGHLANGRIPAGVPVVHEFKFTWYSSRKDLYEKWMWLAQTKAYCLAIDTAWAIWHIYWVNGDYRDSGPQYKLYLIEFSKVELKENWSMVRNHSRGLKR